MKNPGYERSEERKLLVSCLLQFFRFLEFKKNSGSDPFILVAIMCTSVVIGRTYVVFLIVTNC